MENDTTLTIQRQDDTSTGAFFILNGDGDGPKDWLAELTYRWRSDGDQRVMVVDHTGVRDALKGQGVARRLVDTAVAAARAEGFRIQPVCSYVAHVFDKAGDTLADLRA